MADSFKSSILLGFKLEDSKSLNTKVQDVIKTLNNTKINLDINILNSDVAKQLETLTSLANNFKNTLGGNINLGNVSDVIKQALSSMEKLNGEVLKTNVRAFDDVISVTKNVATNIGEVTQQTQKFQKMGDELRPFGQAITTVTEDVKKLNSTLNNIDNAKKSLDALKLNGFVNTESIDKLKTDLNSLYDGIKNRKETGITFNENDIKPYLEQVKQLETEEKNLIKIEQERVEQIQKENELNTKLNNAEFLNNQKTAYKSLFDLQNEEYSLKEKLITAEGQYKQQLSERLVTVNQLKSAQQQSIQDNNLSNLQREVELENQKVRLEEQFKLAQTKNNDSNINSLSKDINSTISQLDKMQQKFGSKLPNGFVESITKELNSLLSKLKETDNVNFNNIRNSLNTIKSSMEQTNTETKQLVNSLKETNNGGFFSGLSNFLSKVGIFYGVQQVVQEISQQFRNASEYTQMLDKSVTNIQMITGKTKEEVIGITNQFKELGSQLHITNQEMLAGSEELMRAGYDNSTTSKMLEASSMASKISGQTTQATTEQLIAIKNAFNMTGDQMQHVIDVVSKLDNTSATSLDFDDLVA